MNERDESIRRICVASIKRSTNNASGYSFTKIFETQSMADIDKGISAVFLSTEKEVPIALTYLDNSNWTLVTTRQIISNIDGQIKQVFIENIVQCKWGDFKSSNDKPITLGQLALADNSPINIFIETGHASMIVIYAIKTLTRIYRTGNTRT